MKSFGKTGLSYSKVILSLSIALMPCSYALSPINSLNDSRIIQGGTYYNTSDAKTTFVNSGSGGLWLQSGTTVRGLEVNSSGNLTNNGGTIQLYAPGNVVRVDGNLDVSGLVNGKGAYIGDGGKVFVDAGYLYQNGNILANGQNGGLVQVNVGAATLTNGALIEAKGLNGAGGVVNFVSVGPVDLQQGSTINTSGLTVGAFDRNVINIEGGMVNVEGVLRADGISSAGQGARGGIIRLISSARSDQQSINDALNAATFRNPGETIAPTISPALRDSLIGRNNEFLSPNDENILIGTQGISNTVSLISANGAGDIPSSVNDPQGGPTRAGDGGTIILNSNRDIVPFLGTIQANGANGGNRVTPYAGGNGGTIEMSAQSIFGATPGSIVKANGGAGGSTLSNTGTGAKGGDGGLIAISVNDYLIVPGRMQANGAVGGRGNMPGQGGQGGLVVFSGGFNTDLNGGLVTANGAYGGNASAAQGGLPGSVVQYAALNPDNAKQLGFINGQFVNKPLTQFVGERELLTHGDSLISLVNSGSINENFLKDTLPNSTIRSVTDPDGILGTARQEVIDKNTSTSSYVYRNLMVGSAGGQTDLNFAPLDADSMKVLSNDRTFSTLNTFTVRDFGNVSNDNQSSQPSNFWIMGREHNIFGGGHIAIQTYYGNSIRDNDTLQTNGTANSGSILLTSANFLNVGTTLPTQVTTNGGLHGGQIQLKSGTNLVIAGTDTATALNADSRLMGGNINIVAPGTYTSQLNTNLSSDATGTAGNSQAGIITIKANSTVTNGQDFGVDGLVSRIHANANNGRGGYVQLASEGTVVNDIVVIEANGGQHGGVVSLTGKTATISSPGLPQMLVPSMTPPKTTIQGSAGTDFVGVGSVYNLGAINALGKGGRLYLGGNDGVVFAEKDPALYPNSPLPSLNGQAIMPSVIFGSSNPNATLQAIGQNINKNGQQAYVLAGWNLTNTLGQTRSAADIVNGEAAPNHSAPNVSPDQDGQGSAFTQDFQIQPTP